MSESTELSPAQRLIQLQEGIDYVKDGAEIVAIRPLGHDKVKDGIVHRFGLITKAGYAHCGTVNEPFEPTSDIAILSTDAWGTGPRGHNEHTDRATMHDGLWTIRLSNEGSYHPLIPPIPKRKMTLAGTAATALTFSTLAANELFAGKFHPIFRTAHGESKGGMEGQGTVALAPFFGQEVLMADFTAPCIPKQIQSDQLGELLQQFRNEPAAIFSLVGRLATGALMHYPATIDLHPYSVIHQALKGEAVFSGDAGRLGRLVAKDQLMHITTFSSDFASMPSEWRDIYGDNPNARITPLDGSHLTLADPETKAYMRARQRAFRELYAAHGNRLRDEDGKTLFSGPEVFDLAHKYVSIYLQPLPKNRFQRIVRVICHADNQDYTASAQLPEAA